MQAVKERFEERQLVYGGLAYVAGAPPLDHGLES